MKGRHCVTDIICIIVEAWIWWLDIAGTVSIHTISFCVLDGRQRRCGQKTVLLYSNQEARAFVRSMVLFLSASDVSVCKVRCLIHFFFFFLGGGGSAGAYCLALMRVLKRSTDAACTAAVSRWFHSLVVRTKQFFSWSLLHLGTWNVREFFRMWWWIPLVATQSVKVFAQIGRRGLCPARNSEGRNVRPVPRRKRKEKKSGVFGFGDWTSLARYSYIPLGFVNWTVDRRCGQMCSGWTLVMEWAWHVHKQWLSTSA